MAWQSVSLGSPLRLTKNLRLWTSTTLTIQLQPDQCLPVASHTCPSPSLERSFHNLRHNSRWKQERFPSSSSRSPESSAEQVCANKRTRVGNWHKTDCGSPRLARWCHPSQSRIHGRHEPKHYPQRQGTRYETPRCVPGNMRDLKLTSIFKTVKVDDILCLLESEREARRLR